MKSLFSLTLFLVDVNECDKSTGIVHGCVGSCVNTEGNYKCTCPNGYFLANDGKNSIGKNKFLNLYFRNENEKLNQTKNLNALIYTKCLHYPKVQITKQKWHSL